MLYSNTTTLLSRVTPRWVASSTRKTGDKWSRYFYRPNALPVTQLAVSKHLRKHSRKKLGKTTHLLREEISLDAVPLMHYIAIPDIFLKDLWQLHITWVTVVTIENWAANQTVIILSSWSAAELNLILRIKRVSTYLCQW